MLTFEIKKLLEERNYVIKKASELIKLIDVDINTQIKNVTFKPDSNDYYIRIVDVNQYGKTYEEIIKFHVYTIEQYHDECKMMGIVPEDLEEAKPVVEQPAQIIPIVQETEKKPTGIVAQFNDRSNRTKKIESLRALSLSYKPYTSDEKHKTFTLNTKAN